MPGLHYSDQIRRIFGAGEAVDFGHWASLFPCSQLSFWLCPFFLLRCCIDGFLSWKVSVLEHKRTLRSATRTTTKSLAPAAGEGRRDFLSSYSVLMHQVPVLVCQTQGLFLILSGAPHFSAGSAPAESECVPCCYQQLPVPHKPLNSDWWAEYNIILEGSWVAYCLGGRPSSSPRPCPRPPQSLKERECWEILIKHRWPPGISFILVTLANLAQVNKALMHGLLLVPLMFVLRLLNLFPKQFSLTTVIWRNYSCKRLQDNFVEVSFVPVTSSLLPFCACVCRRTHGCPGGIEVRGEPCRKCSAGLSQPILSVPPGSQDAWLFMRILRTF